MLTVHPQYTNDIYGNKSLVVLPADEFDLIMDALDESEDIRLYDEVKKNNTGERVATQEAFTMIEANRKSNS